MCRICISQHDAIERIPFSVKLHKAIYSLALVFMLFIWYRTWLCHFGSCQVSRWGHETLKAKAYFLHLVIVFWAIANHVKSFFERKMTEAWLLTSLSIIFHSWLSGILTSKGMVPASLFSFPLKNYKDSIKKIMESFHQQIYISDMLDIRL